jgi:NHL repeat
VRSEATAPSAKIVSVVPQRRGTLVRWLTALTCALLLTALMAGPAHGATIHSLTGTIGSAGSAGGQLSEPRGLAIDQSTGDVYVAERGNRRISKFDSAGNFLLTWGIDVVQSGPDNLPDSSEVQKVTVTATGGTFSLSFENDPGHGATYGSIPYNATAAQLEAQLNAESSGTGIKFYGGSVSVSGGPGDATGSSPYLITFGGQMANRDVRQLQVNGAALTGGTPGPSAAIETVTQGVSNFEVCKQGIDICKAGVRGGGAGKQFVLPAYLAVDNSGGPSDGAVYVSDLGSEQWSNGTDLNTPGIVEKFSSNGEYLSSNDGSASGAKIVWELGSVAVDPSGNLFVQNAGTNKYGPDGTFLQKIPQGGAPLAVDAFGNLYYQVGGGEGVIKHRFDGSFADRFTVFLQPEIGGDVGIPLAIDPATQALYAARKGVVETYATTDTESQLLEQFGQGDVTTPRGIAVRGFNGTAYVSEPASNNVLVYESVTIPDAVTGTVSDRTTVSATLNGTVNPLGTKAQYQFEWGKTTSYGNLAPALPAEAGEGVEPVTVSEELAGLEPGTTYHYRLNGTNENGTFHGPDRTFTTLFPVAIDAVFTSAVGSSGAVVNAIIDPGGGPATFQVEYGTTSAYGKTVPAAGALVGSGLGGVAINQALVGLQPDTTYHYRFVAENAGSSAVSEDRAFHTFALPQAGLPNGRAYEMVSPPHKNGGDITTHPDLTRVAADGNAAVFASMSAFGDSQGTNGIGNEYIAERASNGWNTHGITPLQIPQEFPQFSSGFMGDFSPDLEKAIFLAAPTLEPGHPNVQDSYNLYAASNLRTPHGGKFQLLSDSVNPVSAVAMHPYEKINLAASSADFSRVLFESRDPLTVDATGLSIINPKLYLSIEGDVRLEGLVPPPGEISCGPSGPACEVAPASIAGSGVSDAITSDGDRDRTYSAHTLSADGSRVFLEVPPFSGGVSHPTGVGAFGTLYLRDDGETTTQLNVSERTEPDPAGPQPAKLLDATPDGSKAFFVTKEQLLDEDANSSYDIYMSSVDKPVGSRLSLISVDNNGLDGAGDARYVVGTSSDGKYVYFTAANQLVPGQPSLAELELPESQASEFMYVWHQGLVRFVGAHGHDVPFSNWGGAHALSALGSLSSGQKTAVVTPDGKHAAFTSEAAGLARLSVGVDIRSAACNKELKQEPKPCQEVYAYDFEADHLTCASCNRTGLAPRGRALTTVFADNSAAQLLSQHVNRPISDDGRYVFFSSPDQLVSADNNGRYDAYQYDMASGKVALISTGQCNCNSYFVEQSPDGHDVFFTTKQRLVAIDFDENADLYDARIDGGIAAQNALPPPQCQGDSCQPAPTPPIDATPASATFNGAGNLAETKAKRKRQKQKARCRRAKRKGAHSQRAKRANGCKRTANRNRGGAK